jgi:ubiquinol-cytochrome c reductase core subunit 2
LQNTTKRSALRLQREAELLGGTWESYLSRENIVLKAKFLRNDLPYFVEALGEVLSKTRFLRKEVAPAVPIISDVFKPMSSARRSSLP